MNTTDSDFQRQAWNLYADAKIRAIFHAILTTYGPWRTTEGVDLIQDFIHERLPNALRTFNPEVGELEPWIYTVFRNFAICRKNEEKRLNQRFVSLTDLVEPPLTRGEVPENTLTQATPSQIKASLTKLNPESRRIVLTYFSENKQASFRALSRQFKMTRYTARKRLFEALAVLVSDLEKKELISHQESRVFQDYAVRRLNWKQISRREKLSLEEVQILFKDTLRLLSDGLLNSD